MRIAHHIVGFSEVPGKITLNVFAVGCKKRCVGCHNPKLQNFDFEEAKILTNQELERLLVSGKDLFDGVVWLGGDAIYQNDRLIELSKIIKDNKKFNCLFTGIKFDEIGEDTKKLLDVVVDGEYEGKKYDDPSTNQKIWMKINKVWKIITFCEFNNFKEL